jgi:ubiquinone/menaquinone biosynthesis C-methylase UbiE
VVEPKQLVRDGYDQIAEAYASWEEAGGVKETYLNRLRELVPEGEAVLDLGCGTGERVTRHLAASYEATGVDLSPHSVEVARREVPEATFVVGDMATISFPPGSFAGVTAFFSLIHVPRDEQGAVLRSIAGWLRPGGHLIVTMGAAEGEGTGDFLGAEMYWSSWSAEQNLELLRQAGFEVLSADEVAEEEHGEPVTFLWVVAQRD